MSASDGRLTDTCEGSSGLAAAPSTPETLATDSVSARM